MKKILIIILLILGITGCSINNKTNNKGTSNTLGQEPEKVKKYTKSEDISFDEYISKIENKESFGLLMWQTGCSHCEDFEPKLNKVIKEYNIKMYSIDLSKLDDNQYAKIKNKTFVNGTPTTVYFKDGITQSTKLVGNKSEEQIIEFFKEYKIIG